MPNQDIKLISPHSWLGLPWEVGSEKMKFTLQGSIQPDLLYAGGLVDIYSEKLLSIIEKYTDALECYPVTLVAKSGSAIEYFIVNFLGLYSISDNNNVHSIPKYDHFTDPKIFRSTELMPSICISNDVFREFVDKKITGMRLQKL